MPRRYKVKHRTDPSQADDALEAMDAEGLRDLIRDLMLELDETTLTWLIDSLIERAARDASGWVPTGPTEDAVADIENFAQAAKRVGYAEPSEVDGYLGKATNAFLAKDYHSAHRIYTALLLPISHGEIDLGQDELIEEVLGSDVKACAGRYVVSTYMCTTPEKRVNAVLTALDEVSTIGYFQEPLKMLEEVAVESLPDFDAFLAGWSAQIENRKNYGKRGIWDNAEDHWLREAVQRLNGLEGLARLARKTKHSNDLRAWCRALIDSKDWKSALEACEEAAEIVSDDDHSRGGFLDGAALAVQQLGRKDLPEILEKAWRASPNLIRLLRWLGSTTSKSQLRIFVSSALAACPKDARRQSAVLYVLHGDFENAAKLLAGSSGLGWSNPDHPGRLIVPIFTSLLTNTPFRTAQVSDFDSIDSFGEADGHRLPTPDLAAIIELAGIAAPMDTKACTVMLSAMRKAAEKRLDGVVANKRRDTYRDAADLVGLCADLDRSEKTSRWIEAIQTKYLRYPALQKALDASLGDGE